jgi:hypothetical protein
MCCLLFVISGLSGSGSKEVSCSIELAALQANGGARMKPDFQRPKSQTRFGH